jgi:hypothetical protein
VKYINIADERCLENDYKSSKFFTVAEEMLNWQWCASEELQTLQKLYIG